jgi:GNAT superfamily N-acetyltransferase
MNPDTAIASVEYFYRRMYWQAPAAITHSTPDYTLTYSGVAWLSSVNQLWLHRPEALDDPLLAYARYFFAHSGAEYDIVLPALPGARPERSAWLADRRFVERAADPIYALHGPPRPRHIHPTARIIRAREEHQEVLLQALYSTFFVGPEIGRCLARAEHFHDPTIRHYLAYVDGDVAACTTILLNGAVAGVWNVGTLHPYRQQGLASTLLRQALAEAAADGYADSVLIASPMGRPLYEEMGYRWVGSTVHYGPAD